MTRMPRSTTNGSLAGGARKSRVPLPFKASNLQGYAASRHPLPPHLVHWTAAGAIVFLAVFAALLRFSDYEAFTRNVLYLVPPFVALALAGVAALRSTGREQRGWVSVGFGIACWTLGDLVYAFYSLAFDSSLGLPSTADAFYLPGYLCFAIAFVHLFPLRFEIPDSRVIVDAFAVLLATVAISWPYLIAPAFAADLQGLNLVVAGAYPVLDVAVISVLVVTFYGSGERAPLRFLMLFLALGFSIAGDSLYASQLTLSGEYAKALDVLFVAIYCCIAVAIAAPDTVVTSVSRRVTMLKRSSISLQLPRALTIPLVALAIFDTPIEGSREAVLDLGAAGMIALIALRHALIGRENASLLDRLQRDSNERAALLRALGDLGEAFAILQGGRVISANHALWLILGYTEAEVRAMRSFDQVIAERDRGRITTIMQRALATGSVISGAEITVVTKQGKEVPVELASMPLENNGRQQLLIVARDITERKQTQRMVLESQKLEGLRILAGGVAHDFNNLLQVIRGSAALALLEAGPESVAAPYLTEIDTASDRAAGLARQMLIYAGKADPIVSAVEPSEVVEDMALLLRSSLGDGIDIQVSSGRYTHRVMVDASQLRQVVMNLVVNASESIGAKGGTIAVNTSNRYFTQQALASAHAGNDLQPGLYVVIEVTDNGAGMTEEVRRRIFDPFYTTKFTGRGLGLAAVLGIVRAHGGGIAVESSPGNGATFRVLLPADIAVAAVS